MLFHNISKIFLLHKKTINAYNRAFELMSSLGSVIIQFKIIIIDCKTVI